MGKFHFLNFSNLCLLLKCSKTVNEREVNSGELLTVSSIFKVNYQKENSHNQACVVKLLSMYYSVVVFFVKDYILLFPTVSTFVKLRFC